MQIYGLSLLQISADADNCSLMQISAADICICSRYLPDICIWLIAADISSLMQTSAALSLMQISGRYLRDAALSLMQR